MSNDDSSAADRGSECNDLLGPPPVGALTVGEEALLRAWADRYATKKVAAERERCAKVCEEDAFVDQWRGLAEAARRIRGA